MAALLSLLPLALLVAGGRNPSPGLPSTCAVPSSARDDVAATIKGYFKALVDEDASTATELTSTGFHAYDAGEKYRGAELLKTVREAHRAGMVLQWNLGPMDIHVDCSMAWATWENHGAAGPATALQPVTWLESATLHLDHGKWVIEFLHSTRARASAAAPKVSGPDSGRPQDNLPDPSGNSSPAVSTDNVTPGSGVVPRRALTVAW